MKKGVLILGAVVLLAACGESHAPEASRAPTDVPATPVQAEEIALHVPAEGTVVAR